SIVSAVYGKSRSSIRLLRALDGGTEHQPALVGGKIVARMRRAAVVPYDQIADPPLVAVDELRLLRGVEQRTEQRVALLGRKAVDSYGHQPVDVDRLAPGLVVRAKDRVVGLGEGLDPVRAAARGGAVVVMMKGAASLELLPETGIERLVRRIAAREQRIAAMARDLHRVEQRAVVRNLGMDLVVVEVHLAIRQRPDGLAVLADVRDHHDVGQQPRISLGEELLRARQRRDLAEITCHPDQILLRETLATKQEDEVVEPRLVDRLHGLGVELVAQVDAADLGADVLRQRNHVESGEGCSAHGEPRWRETSPSLSSWLIAGNAPWMVWPLAHFPRAARPLLVGASIRPSSRICNRLANSVWRNGFAIIGHSISPGS